MAETHTEQRDSALSPLPPIPKDAGPQLPHAERVPRVGLEAGVTPDGGGFSKMLLAAYFPRLLQLTGAPAWNLAACQGRKGTRPKRFSSLVLWVSQDKASHPQEQEDRPRGPQEAPLGLVFGSGGRNPKRWGLTQRLRLDTGGARSAETV